MPGGQQQGLRASSLLRHRTLLLVAVVLACSSVACSSGAPVSAVAPPGTIGTSAFAAVARKPALAGGFAGTNESSSSSSSIGSLSSSDTAGSDSSSSDDGSSSSTSSNTSSSSSEAGAWESRERGMFMVRVVAAVLLGLSLVVTAVGLWCGWERAGSVARHGSSPLHGDESNHDDTVAVNIVTGAAHRRTSSNSQNGHGTDRSGNQRESQGDNDADADDESAALLRRGTNRSQSGRGERGSQYRSSRLRTSVDAEAAERANRWPSLSRRWKEMLFGRREPSHDMLSSLDDVTGAAQSQSESTSRLHGQATNAVLNQDDDDVSASDPALVTWSATATATATTDNTSPAAQERFGFHDAAVAGDAASTTTPTRSEDLPNATPLRVHSDGGADPPSADGHSPEPRGVAGGEDRRNPFAPDEEEVASVGGEQQNAAAAAEGRTTPSAAKRLSSGRSSQYFEPCQPVLVPKTTESPRHQHEAPPDQAESQPPEASADEQSQEAMRYMEQEPREEARRDVLAEKKECEVPFRNTLQEDLVLENQPPSGAVTTSSSSQKDREGTDDDGIVISQSHDDDGSTSNKEESRLSYYSPALESEGSPDGGWTDGTLGVGDDAALSGNVDNEYSPSTVSRRRFSVPPTYTVAVDGGWGGANALLDDLCALDDDLSLYSTAAEGDTATAGGLSRYRGTPIVVFSGASSAVSHATTHNTTATAETPPQFIATRSGTPSQPLPQALALPAAATGTSGEGEQDNASFGSSSASLPVRQPRGGQEDDCGAAAQPVRCYYYKEQVVLPPAAYTYTNSGLCDSRYTSPCLNGGNAAPSIRKKDGGAAEDEEADGERTGSTSPPVAVEAKRGSSDDDEVDNDGAPFRGVAVSVGCGGLSRQERELLFKSKKWLFPLIDGTEEL